MRESFEDVKLQSYIITRNVSVHMLTTNKNNILTPSLEKYKTIWINFEKRRKFLDWDNADWKQYALFYFSLIFHY